MGQTQSSNVNYVTQASGAYGCILDMRISSNKIALETLLDATKYIVSFSLDGQEEHISVQTFKQKVDLRSVKFMHGGTYNHKHL